jgi:RimJ/RimL family protein N-acetyltransferase
MITPRVSTLDRLTAPAAVDAVFAGLSEHSRYLRFHAPMPRLTRAFRDRLVDIDGLDHAALVARIGDRAIGIARLVRTGCGKAELAISVVDRWQRQGVGRCLLSALGNLATELGYTELHGDVLPENTAMLRLARRAFPGARTVRDDDVMRVTYPLGWAMGTLTHEEVLADLLHR